MAELSHVNEKGEVRMVDVTAKDETERIAIAEGRIFMEPETLGKIVDGTVAKGDVLACARVAGIMASKKTSEIIPMCHPIMITKCEVELEPFEDAGCSGIYCKTTCKTTGKTGIEMEALHATSAALLTVYDMCKAVDRGMEIKYIRLLKKDGGKSGLWER